MKHKLGYRKSKHVTIGLILALAILLGSAQLVVAAEPAFTMEFPAGLVCNFALRVDGFGEPHRVDKVFTDKNGYVRVLSAGKGFELLYTNLATGATMSTEANGSINHTTYNPDGTATLELTGHNVVFLYPTDVPAGPSTTLYVGRVTFTVDTLGNWTKQQVIGKTFDICAALSQ